MPFHYPPAPRGETMDVLHGHRVLDPYRWLEEAEAPATRDWLARQHDLAQAYLKRLPGRDAMAALLEASLAHDQVSVPRPRGRRSSSRAGGRTTNATACGGADRTAPRTASSTSAAGKGPYWRRGTSRRTGT